MAESKNKAGNLELFSSVKISRKPDKVYKQLVSMINSGRIKPGERLPSERDLSSYLGISRQSLREAIYRAESVGLIEVRQGEGSFVVSSARENLKDPVTALLEEHAGKIFDFLEMRKLIEGWSAARAAETAGEDDLSAMENTLRDMNDVVPTDKGWERVDTDFHLQIVNATQNVVAIHIMHTLRDTFHTYFRMRRIVTKARRKEILLRQHSEILDAIRQRNASLAKRRTLKHLDFIGKLIVEDMDSVRSD